MDPDRLSPFEALDLAVTRSGSQSALAKICNVSQPAVWKWLADRKPLPAECVLDVETATGVSRHDLRPDVYPRGLQDDVPFRPDVLELGEFDQLVADESDAVLQAGTGGGA